MSSQYNQWHKPDDLIVADRERETYGIPAYVHRAWKSQRDSARNRGIKFRFCLFQWHCWWNSELAAIGPDAKRGNRKGQYMMARIGDAGAYEHGNVYAALPQDNARDIPDDVRAAMKEKVTATRIARGIPRGQHLKVRGDEHPKSKAVETPLGYFGSIALASEAHGITRAGGHYRVKRGEWTLA